MLDFKVILVGRYGSGVVEIGGMLDILGVKVAKRETNMPQLINPYGNYQFKDMKSTCDAPYVFRNELRVEDSEKPFIMMLSKEEFLKSQVVIANPKEAYELMENFPNCTFQVYFLDSSVEQRLKFIGSIVSKERFLLMENDESRMYDIFEDILKSPVMENNYGSILNDTNYIIEQYPLEASHIKDLLTKIDLYSTVIESFVKKGLLKLTHAPEPRVEYHIGEDMMPYISELISKEKMGIAVIDLVKMFYRDNNIFELFCEDVLKSICDTNE